MERGDGSCAITKLRMNLSFLCTLDIQVRVKAILISPSVKVSKCAKTLALETLREIGLIK